MPETTAEKTPQALEYPIKYSLKYPFTTGAGMRIDSFNIRRLNRADLRKAQAFSKNDSDQENYLLAAMTGSVMEDLDHVDLADSKALADFFRNLVDGKGESASI
ncbi:phage tail assembly protein [Pseudomonas helleri]|uniref:phage tail assembly protein n=1 Tax=Pseudomonas helleri TaxID=1608996 RepID=UPI003FD67605